MIIFLILTKAGVQTDLLKNPRPTGYKAPMPMGYFLTTTKAHIKHSGKIVSMGFGRKQIQNFFRVINYSYFWGAGFGWGTHRLVKIVINKTIQYICVGGLRGEGSSFEVRVDCKY